MALDKLGQHAKAKTEKDEATALHFNPAGLL
jgi:hypothetical protein